MNLSGCMGVRPLASGAMMVHAGPGRGSPPQKLQCFGCYAKVPALILGQPGPTQRPSNTTNTGKPHPLNTYILRVFSFWTLLIIVSWRGYTQFRLSKKWWGGTILYTNKTRVTLKAIYSLAVGALPSRYSQPIKILPLQQLYLLSGKHKKSNMFVLLTPPWYPSIIGIPTVGHTMIKTRCVFFRGPLPWIELLDEHHH